MRSFKLALAFSLFTTAASAGWLALLHAGMGTGVSVVVQGFLIQQAALGFILQGDGTSKIQWAQ